MHKISKFKIKRVISGDRQRYFIRKLEVLGSYHNRPQDHDVSDWESIYLSNDFANDAAFEDDSYTVQIPEDKKRDLRHINYNCKLLELTCQKN